MTSDSSVVRSARVADAEAIGRIHVASWQAAYADALPEKFLRGLSIPHRQRAWQRRLEAGDRSTQLLVVTEGGMVVGFACAGASRDDDVPVGTGELQSIYLDPAAWGRGLGRSLHTGVLAALRRDGYQRATLWVLDSNARARRFYERTGWTLDNASKIDNIAGSPPLTEVRYTRPL